ncbi:unnamed protein product [Gongylonema pulchrum]|uniref:TMF_TATA_bd domain-containing protein n=1 Tax=Gongylonema pulchrum TaxID=637853 RepID=A0A183E5S8_9BILA|nr:unnamed protein product [Gongylonema pulchrum]
MATAIEMTSFEDEEGSAAWPSSTGEESTDAIERAGENVSESDHLKEQLRLLTEERDSLRLKIIVILSSHPTSCAFFGLFESGRLQVKSAQEENAAQADHVDKLTFQAVDKVLSARLKEMEQQCEFLQEQLEAATEQLNNKNVQLSELQTELEQTHSLIDVQREKFQRDISEEKERSRYSLIVAQIEEARSEVEKIRLLAESREEVGKNDAESEMSETIEKLKNEIASWQKRFEISETIFEEEQTAKERELEKLSARIDALKANLIEYEERYELCRNENAETVQQLEKLSNDFDRLRLSLSKNTAVEVDELKRLRTELDVSKGDREKLRADVERFRAAIGVIDKELNRLR